MSGDVTTDDARLLVLPVDDRDHLGLRVFDPAAQDDRAPVVLVVPAMGIVATYYDPLARGVAATGSPVVVCDLRGHGGSTPGVSRASRFGQQELVAVDLPAAVAVTRREFPGRPVVLLGHSIGGQLGAAYLGRPEADVDGLALIASGTPHHRVYPRLRGLRVLLGTQTAALLGRAWGYFPGDRVGFGGRESARVITDWARFARTGRFAPAGADLDYEQAMSRVDLPVLVVSVEGDLMHTPAAMDELTGKLASKRVTRLRYTAADAGQKLDRYRWVRVPGPLPGWLRDWWRDVSDDEGAQS
ncbi:Predicted alpha/beta hydrolase [Lentzea fradiae]|uniref:Predicted alpha/beta hydrolase n=1 Tax=Lentzea fradiae TaxID=200378 RepID=A0A1G7QYL8_9PSEU|nr:alpha/beta fold hydrolase [Lentzea fradiae]SDG03621.1 Predicted alpha/beta hydrolase [Lentzea fradiae]